MDDIYLVIIGIILITVIGVTTFYIMKDEVNTDTDTDTDTDTEEEEEEEEAAEEEAAQEEAAEEPAQDVSFVLGKGRLRPPGSNILYNVGSSTGPDDRPPTRDSPSSGPPFMKSGTCTIGYHKKPHAKLNYRKYGFTTESVDGQGFVSRNTVPTCILNR